MPAGTAFPTWAYSTNATVSPQVVVSQAALTALGPTWSTTPPVTQGQIAPFDTGFIDTDIRLQQIMIELRVLNALFQQANPGGDDPQALRADVLAVDVGLTT